MSNFIRKFKKFQSDKRQVSVNEKVNNKTVSDKINEAVIERNGKYIISGIEIPLSLVNSFMTKAKKEGSDLSGKFGKEQIAEDIVKYIVDKHSDVDTLPLSIMLGGDDEMESQIDDVSMEENGVEVGDDGMEDIIDDTNDMDSMEDDESPLEDIDDEFESVIDDEDIEDSDIDLGEDEEDEEDEENELPTEDEDGKEDREDFE